MGYFALGRSWIVDPLNEQYFNPNLQLWYRQSIAHNTVVLDQTTQTWTNGYYRFFGALPALQVASGASTTEYPGARLTRTLLQVGDYFVDLCDVQAREARLIDWPSAQLWQAHGGRRKPGARACGPIRQTARYTGLRSVN